MFSIKQMRGLARKLTAGEFKKELGPFALIQRPPSGGPMDMAQLGATMTARREDISRGVLGFLFEFEDLLVCTVPPLAGEDSLNVGRLPDNELVIEHPSVSKRHATVKWNAKTKSCTLVDSSSTNGTFLNDCVRVQGETTLKDGDIISFGDVQYWFLLTETLYYRLAEPSGSYKLGSRSG